MLRAETRFTFHNVGQGLFYSGEIEFNDDKRFLFIYDCGSESKNAIEKAINDFSKETKKKEIDMLVISHFHNDHISGLNYLLNKYNIKIAIIPYFHPLLRLLIAILNQNQESWYYEFLANPVSYLLSREVERVIMIVGDSPDENNPNEENLPRRPDNLSDNDLVNIVLKEIDDKTKKEIVSNENLGGLNNKIKIYSHKGYITLKDYITLLEVWLFKFFNYESNKQLLDSLEKCLNENISNFSPNKVSEIIRNIEKYKGKIKKCYEYIKKQFLLKDFNNTSLVMMHTPINHDTLKVKGVFYLICPFPIFFSSNLVDYFCEEFLYLHREFYYRCKDIINRTCKYICSAQALTGDIDLNYDYGSFKKHFSYFQEKLLICQIPHHGSYKNWNKDFVEDFKIPIHVASAGKFNKYGHPSKKVFEDIIKNYSIPIIVDENKWFTLKAEITWSGRDDRAGFR